MSGWGTSWNKPKTEVKWPSANEVSKELKEAATTNPWPVKEMFEEIIEESKFKKDVELHGIGFMQNGKHVPLEKVYNNLSPTHDPYTNPNSHIYYECKCGAILDPNTKSFAALNNYASEKGWKVRWRQDGAGYEPFCVECGKDVE